MCLILMINLMIVKQAAFTLGSVTPLDKKIKSNNSQFLCGGRWINILVSFFLLRYRNWFERYSTMKIGRLFEYIYILYYQSSITIHFPPTIVPTKCDSYVLLCLQLLSEKIACTFHLTLRKSIDHLCINPILRIQLIHKRYID